MSLAADYFDGHSSRCHRVALSCESGVLRVCGEGVERVAPLHELRVSEAMGDAPRLVSFSDGAYCEIRDPAGFQALLEATGFRDHCVVRWQSSRPWIIAASCLCLFCLFAGYRWGLPWFAEQIADRLPFRVLEVVSTQVLESLDAGVLGPTALSEGRQEEIVERFAAMHRPGSPDMPHHVIFRANRGLPANAMALPSGTIVLTDDLVALAANDSQLMAVLAHEWGHVQARHGMRLVIQSTLVGVLAAWFLGDVSSMVSAAPAALLEASYSRDFEREADDFAAHLLQENGLSPRCLADVLLRLASASNAGAGLAPYLASHPASVQRAKDLQGTPCE